MEVYTNLMLSNFNSDLMQLINAGPLLLNVILKSKNIAMKRMTLMINFVLSVSKEKLMLQI